MKQIRAQKTINVPKDVKVEIDSRRVTVTGPKGTLKRDFRHMPVAIQKIEAGRKVEVSVYFGLSKQLAGLRTVCSHIDNLIVSYLFVAPASLSAFPFHGGFQVQAVSAWTFE